jgi:hypothetical protein
MGSTFFEGYINGVKDASRFDVVGAGGEILKNYLEDIGERFKVIAELPGLSQAERLMRTATEMQVKADGGKWGRVQFSETERALSMRVLAGNCLE